MDNYDIHYFCTENEEEAFLKRQELIEKNYLTSWVEAVNEKNATDPTAKSQILSQLKDILQQKYPEAYFQFLAHFNATEPNDLARPLLDEYLSEFSDTLNMCKIIANSKLINLAYSAKLLNIKSYNALIQQCHYIKQNTLNYHTHPNLRYLAGIGYIDPNQTIMYYFNAYLPNVINQIIRLEKETRIISPVLYKSHNLFEITSIKDTREDFSNILREAIDFEYLNMVKKLRLIPSAINPLFFRDHLISIKDTLSENALKAIDNYSVLWNIPKV